MLASRAVLGTLAVALALHTGCGDGDDGSGGSGGSGGTGGTAECSSLDEGACDDDPACNWLAVGCHSETFFDGCFDEDYSPGQPFCADQPCPDYDTEQACTEQEACNWWPLDCPGRAITDQCLNMAYGDPEGTCSTDSGT